MAKKELYIVTAYRWGDRENHSYTIGVFDKKQAAINCAESHTTYRGGKYSCFVEAALLNEFNNDANDYTVTIYKTKSVANK